MMKYINRIILVLPFFLIAFLGLVVYFITRSDELTRPFDVILLEIADLCDIELREE